MGLIPPAHGSVEESGVAYFRLGAGVEYRDEAREAALGFSTKSWMTDWRKLISKRPEQRSGRLRLAPY